MTPEQQRAELQAKARAKLASFQAPSPTSSQEAPAAFLPNGAVESSWLQRIDHKLAWTNGLLSTILALMLIWMGLSILGSFFGFVGDLMHAAPRPTP